MNDRELAVKLAEDLYADKIDYDYFLMNYPECEYKEDNDIYDLFDLIEHEPKVGWIFGISKREHEQYIEQIFDLIQKLKNVD